MDTLRGIPEHIEADFGDSIVARDEAIAALGAGAPALGPPDLCWLQKCAKRGGLLGAAYGGSSGEAQGYYHYVLGRDVSSSAAVAAYFALLTSRREAGGVLAGLWGGGEFVIERGFYCCYDAISRLDVRCELCVPGGVAAGAVDADGQLHDATPELFMQAHVCAFVRAMLYDAEMRLNGGSVLAYDPVATPAAEAGLLTTVLALYASGRLPGGLQGVAEEQGFGVAAEHCDLVLAALWQHFRRRQRWEAAASYFRTLAAVHAPAALLLAAAERAQDLGYGAGGVLLSELLAAPLAVPGAGGTPRPPAPLVPATMVGLGVELLLQGESQAAASLARRALAASPRCRPAWLLLAKCFIVERQYAAALVALNVVPTPPLPAAEVELLHVVPPPPCKATTAPHVRLHDGELEAARCHAREEASLDGSRLLAYLPGSILVNKEPLGAALTPDVCPNRITRSVLTAVYELLQDIVAETSWDAFLEVRSRVFLMQHEVATPRPPPEQQQQQGGGGSAEITPQASGQQQQQAAGAEAVAPGPGAAHLAALQAAQQRVLLTKLEELGLHAEALAVEQQQTGGSSTAGTSATSAPTSSSLPTSSGAPTASQQPGADAAAGGSAAGGAQQAPAAGAAAASSAAAVSPPKPQRGSSAGGSPLPTPPASRGRLSSSGGGAGHRGGGSSPQSYYANRLHEQLAKPHARSPGGSSRKMQLGAPVSPPPAGGDEGRTTPPSLSGPAAAPALQQLDQQAGAPPKAQPAAAGSPTPIRKEQQQQQQLRPITPGEAAQQHSMAGRVLLLGRKTHAHTVREAAGGAGSASGRPPSTSGGAAAPAGGGCGVPRSLAPNEVEDLGRYDTASRVARLRSPSTSSSSGITPGLWSAVFGARNTSSSSSQPHQQQQQQVQDGAADAGRAAAAAPADGAAVPAAAVRPVSRLSTGSDSDDDGLSAAAAGLPRIRTRPLGEAAEGDTWRGSSSSSRYSSTMRSFLQPQEASRGGHCRCRRRVLARLGSSGCTCACSRSSQQPLGEGLDRQGSLLRRTTSAASAAASLQGGITPQTSVASARPAAAAGSALASGGFAAARPRRLSLVGESASRSLAADRDGLVKGWLHDDASAEAGAGGAGSDSVGSPGGGGRRLCVRWLDELIVALWHDLQAHMEWRVVDQTLRETRGASAAELVLGVAAAADGEQQQLQQQPGTPQGQGVSDGGGFEPPVLTCSDWMRRGALAERLGQSSDARMAYRACVKLGFSLTAYEALLRLEACTGSIQHTLMAASQVLAWHQQRAGLTPGSSSSAGQAGAGAAAAASASSAAAAPATPSGPASSGAASASASSSSGGVVLMGVPPEEVCWALGEVADVTTVDEVRRAIDGLPAAARAMLAAVLDEWVRWQRVKPEARLPTPVAAAVS